jgi:methionine transaminase
MSALAHEHGALNLAQGFPDLPLHPKLIPALEKALHQGRHQYSPTAGILSLREALQAHFKKTHQADYAPDTEITITCGATEACFLAIAASVKAGDEVIVIEPAFDIYLPAILQIGAIPKFVSLNPFIPGLPREAIENATTSKTTAIIVNSPHNPTGQVLDRDDMLFLSDWTKRHNTILISDEVYEHIVFDGHKHLSAAAFPELRERSIVIGSFGKWFHVTGWRLGFVLAPKERSSHIRRLHQFTTFSAPTPLQEAIAEVISDEEYLNEQSAFFQQKRDLFLSGLSNTFWEFLPASGTYFQVVYFPENYTLPDGDVGFAECLVQDRKLAAIPISVFYKENKRFGLRFCLAKPDEWIQKGSEVLCTI